MPEKDCEQEVDSFLTRLFLEEHPRLMAIALRLLGNLKDAEDAVQEVYLKILKRFRDSEDEPRSCGLAINGIRWTCISILRQRAREMEALGEAIEVDSVPLSYSDIPRLPKGES